MINNKQKTFIEEYLINGHNATKAYKEAYPDCRSGHKQAGARLLTNVDIKQEITKRMDELKQETGWSVEQAQTRLLRYADKAEENKQFSSSVSAVIAVNRMFGLDQDVRITSEAPVDVPIDDVEEIEAQAIQALKLA